MGQLIRYIGRLDIEKKLTIKDYNTEDLLNISVEFIEGVDKGQTQTFQVHIYDLVYRSLRELVMRAGYKDKFNVKTIQYAFAKEEQ